MLKYKIQSLIIFTTAFRGRLGATRVSKTFSAGLNINMYVMFQLMPVGSVPRNLPEAFRINAASQWMDHGQLQQSIRSTIWEAKNC